MVDALARGVPTVHGETLPRRGWFMAAAVVLGIGLGGFFDGILLHQILQWHHMVSTPTPPETVENLKLNTFADGLFHAATWVITVVGVFILLASSGARHERGATGRFWGGSLIGWGLFNVVEGIVDHHVLNLHHVRPGPEQGLYDVGFLAWGGLMLLVGLRLARGAAANREASSP